MKRINLRVTRHGSAEPLLVNVDRWNEVMGFCPPLNSSRAVGRRVLFIIYVSVDIENCFNYN